MAGATIALFAWLWLAGASASAQVTGQGIISGTVTDSSGAVVVGAKITVTNAATNVSNETVTNSTGYFEVGHLNPAVASYKVLAEASGFEGLLREGITLETDAHVSVPMQLKLGASVETVTVAADATLLNTDSGSSGQVLTTRQIESIPVSGNNPTWLSIIAPGVQGSVGQAASTDDTLAWTGLTQDFGNYGRIGDNEFSLDGAPNESNSRASALNPTIDELGETKFDVTAFDASVGHTFGVSVTQTTKAGTNDFHGTVRETYTDKRWAAMNHFQGLNYKYQESIAGCVNGASTSPNCRTIEDDYGWPGTHMNNGSVALGGPVFIPKIIDGKNKLFFFVSVLDDVFSGAGSGTATVPTVQERGGNFTDLIDPNAATNTPANWSSLCPGGQPYYGQYQIYDPFSATRNSNPNFVVSRTPFCGNIVPANRLANNAMATFFNSVMPTPTQNSPLGNNFTYTSISPQTYRDYTGRIDYKVTPNDDIFIRYSRGNYTKGENAWTLGSIDDQEGPRWVDIPAVGWNHTFNASTNLDVTFGGTNFKTQCCFYPGNDAYKPSSLGLPSYTDAYAQAANPSLVELPVLLINSYENGIPGASNTSLGEADNVAQTYRSFALRADLTRVQGRHTIRAGGEYRWQNASTGISGNVSGTYNFDDTYTQQNNGNNTVFQQSNTGLAYAAFLMGVQTSSSVSQNTSGSLQTPFYALYAGDTWRLTRKLTVIPGIRFEQEAGLVEKHNQMIVGWNPTADLSSISGPANTAYAAALASATAAQRAVLPSSLTIQGGPIYAGVNGAPTSNWNNSYRVLPRIAAAYQANSRVVIRGGYGLYYDTLNALNINVNNGNNANIDQDGFSANTNSVSSTTYGQNFVAGTLPISDPFPANASGVRFIAPVGSAGGSMYEVGQSPNIYSQSMVPAREQRAAFGFEYQFSNSMMLDVSYNVGYVTDIQVQKNQAFTPSSFYTGGQQPNTAMNGLLGTTITNPFALANFSGVATSNPAAYSHMSQAGMFKSPTATLGSLVNAYPQMGGLNLQQPLGQSHFQEILFNLTRRYSNGLTLMASFQINDQHDADYFANGFDALPSWEASNNSLPTRFTIEGVYSLPFGRGKMLATSGWESAVFGGFQISGAYEMQPGVLIGFGNAFYVGTPSANLIKIKHPVYHNNQATGGSNYVQWLNAGNATATATSTTNANGTTTTTCTYSGNGFVTNPACQPTGDNLLVFPTRINGVRQMGMNDGQLSMQRTFPIREKMSLETTFNAYNVLDHQILGGANTSVTSTQFGQVTGDGWPSSSGRWLSIQGRLRF
jgi:hypothetical protein